MPLLILKMRVMPIRPKKRCKVRTWEGSESTLNTVRSQANSMAPPDDQETGAESEVETETEISVEVEESTSFATTAVEDVVISQEIAKVEEGQEIDMTEEEVDPLEVEIEIDHQDEGTDLLEDQETDPETETTLGSIEIDGTIEGMTGATGTGMMTEGIEIATTIEGTEESPDLDPDHTLLLEETDQETRVETNRKIEAETGQETKAETKNRERMVKITMVDMTAAGEEDHHPAQTKKLKDILAETTRTATSRKKNLKEPANPTKEKTFKKMDRERTLKNKKVRITILLTDQLVSQIEKNIYRQCS